MRVTSQNSGTPPSPADNEPPAPAGASRAKRGLADTRRLWPPGVITVALDLRDQKSSALVVDAIREWAHNTPALQFRIVSGREGDIRISDDEGLKGDWSVIGTDADNVPLSEPTMHLDRNDDSKTFRATVLHEFGHALGLLHEHQNPEHTINWKKEAVYKAYASDNFPKELVYSQILELPVGDHLGVTTYDSKSVMHYAYPGYITHDGKGVDANNWLSDGDKAIARKLYRLTR
ncbi:M12 family metallopeptidase [Pseudomonas sp. FP2309]|uniref:M12 family metallopeptidase n=1 Tax=Pseudomonas sp. FP2309 TaxID=2954091 RepID=UPI002734F542|nr:M12 family metallopeptidase [Pseudomonas sp. FP2309]WLH69699.1 M12 family metallopeptidase [Pseudomonas sp. FP2309]